MGYVKMPEMLSPELVKALTGNVYTVKEQPNPEEEMAAAWKEYLKEDTICEKKDDKKEDKKHDKKDDKKHRPDECWKDDDDDVCCPQKVKFIFLLDNTVVINVNAIAEENGSPA